MERRYVSVWFKFLLSEWAVKRMPDLKSVPFVFFQMEHGKQIIFCMNDHASKSGITIGMTVPDARALAANLKPLEYKNEVLNKLLDAMAEWSFRYSPTVAIDFPDGLMIDATACTHLWGGERSYIKEIVTRFSSLGYTARAAMGESPGLAWAVARYGREKLIIEPGQAQAAIQSLPPASLRLDSDTVLKMRKLGLTKVGDLLRIPRPSLNRRFGELVTKRLYQAIGSLPEPLTPRHYVEPYIERLNLFEPVASVENIALAISKLLKSLCKRLKDEGIGARSLQLTCYRIDGKIEKIEIGTSVPSRNEATLLKLFSNKIDKIEPALGIDLFVLTAKNIEPFSTHQEELLQSGMGEETVIELVDKVMNRFDRQSVYQYEPKECFWPERSVTTKPVFENGNNWGFCPPRPLSLLKRPELIEVMAPVPDYPPILFRHRGGLFRVKKADGPERIEREWWTESGEPRDYYRLEDENGQRFWIFRSGHYREGQAAEWFLHGYFA